MLTSSPTSEDIVKVATWRSPLHVVGDDHDS